MAIKISGFDPDANEPVEPTRNARTPRSRIPGSGTSQSSRPARETPKKLDAETAEHLFIKYGMTKVKFTELSPKKSISMKNYKSGSSHKSGGPRLAIQPEPTAEKGAPATATPSIPAVEGGETED